MSFRLKSGEWFAFRNTMERLLYQDCVRISRYFRRFCLKKKQAAVLSTVDAERHHSDYFTSPAASVSQAASILRRPGTPKEKEDYVAFLCEKEMQRLTNGHLTNLKRQWKKEIKGIRSILRRSGISTASWQWFRTGPPERQKEEKGENKNDGNKNGGNPDFGMLLLISMLFFMTLGEIVATSLLSAGYIEWNMVLKDVLPTGEVKQININPQLKKGEVILHRGAVLDASIMQYVSNHPMQDEIRLRVDLEKVDNPELSLRKAEKNLGVAPGDGVSVVYKNLSAGEMILPSILLGLVVILLLQNIFRSGGPTLVSPLSSLTKANYKEAFKEGVSVSKVPGITFKDVAGLKEPKVELIEFVKYLKDSNRFKALGAKIPKGALLLGPPGCGKTLLAKALANEADVPFLYMAGSEFVEMIGGLGAARVRDLFKDAKKKSPCIIYIDEIDAIGRKRGGVSGGNEEEDHTLNELLVQMDGIGSNETVILLASTNRHDVLDKALLRAGRFDRHILIDYPTLEEREETFIMYLKKLKLGVDPKTLAPRLAQLSPGMSGADIANICNEAALHAARNKDKEVNPRDFEYAVERTVAGVAKKSSLLSPQEKKVIAYHESGHALTGWLLKNTHALLRVSIKPRVGATLGFAQYLPKEHKLYSREELFENMCMALGGRVSESITFNKVTTGAENDLKKVSELAYNMIRKYGMGESIGLISFEMEGSDSQMITKPYSNKMATMIDEEARKMVAEAYKTTEKMLLDNREKLKLLAETLLKQESLTYEQVKDLIGPPPYGEKQTISIADDLDIEPPGPPQNAPSQPEP
ncbi:paraplegin isoform X3 [Lingula anatina]|uniref:Paraplegin isoform X2 n=1 Tax=Lingula anatina TaxID=7574 RepID=A0A1S3IF91_LINAN|nr:paraplegin isoform X2 [Lingula anatina]XP_013396936.1 paraplegin isoform X3 [Lingula anatina]|eukprot:XP_013396935.1 paraplegin isoform X2 [Lingula anatina]